jgi:hypothetical protein
LVADLQANGQVECANGLIQTLWQE